MCRPKELGGRRCPQHTDPVKHAAYNARRRELYAEKNMAPATKVEFAPAGELRENFLTNEPALKQWFKDSESFRDKIVPNYSEKEWLEYRDDEDLWKPSESKQDAVMYYTDYGFKEIRQYLNYSTPERKANLEPIMGLIDSVLAEAEPPKDPRILYRGLSLSVPDKKQWAEKHFPVGGIVSQKNYMSTTLNPIVSMDFASAFTWTEGEDSVIFEILSKQGAPIGPGLSYQRFTEYEVLMPRETKFKVAAIHHDVPFGAKGQDTAYKNVRATVIQLIDVDEEGDN
jgi:hypothetical protein